MAFLHIPSLFPILLPIVFLLSSMHTYMKLNRNNELVVLRASGFSIWFLIFPAIFNTLIISCLYIFVFNPIFAYMNIKFLRAVMDYFQFQKLAFG
jgi:lipopolysaccharide export system permease protein